MKRILIIEDDPVIAEVQKDYLEASGFKVDIAVNRAGVGEGAGGRGGLDHSRSHASGDRRF